MRRLASLRVLGTAAVPIEPAPRDVRPRVRGDCENARSPRPCPYLGCRHHLATDYVNGELRVIGSDARIDAGSTVAGEDRFVAAAFERMRVVGASCVLDIVDKRAGERTLQAIGVALDVTRERVRQVEQKSLRGMRSRMRSHLGASFEPHDVAMAQPEGFLSR